MPAWPTCARLLLFVVFSLFGQSGHFGPHPRRNYEYPKPFNQARSPSGQTRRSVDDEEPINRQLLLMITDRERRDSTLSPEEGDKEWIIKAATKINSLHPDLKGESTAPPKEGKETAFKDLPVGGTSSSHEMNFHVMSAMHSVNASSIEVVPSDYELKINNFHIKNNGSVNPLNLGLNFTIKENNQDVNISDNLPWNFTISVRKTNAYRGFVNGTVNGSFSKLPVSVPKIQFWGHGYRIQLTVSVTPTSTGQAIERHTKPFDAIPRLRGLNRDLAKIAFAYVHFNGSLAEAQKNEDLFFSSFLNKFAVRNFTVHWSSLHLIVDPPQIHWVYTGRIANIKSAACALYAAIRKGSLIRADNSKWFVQLPMYYNGSIFYGREGPPPEEELYIGGYRFVHIVLVIVLLALIIPVIILMATWRKRERSIQQRYQQRLMKEEPEEEPKNKRTKLNGHLNTGFDGINMSGESSTDPTNSRPIFTIQDPMSYGINATLSPTDALPPTRFRWSAPEKSGVVELTMAQLREQNHNFMEQGTGLSFSRYKNIIHQKNSETIGPKQGKPFSAPVVPSLSKWNLPTRGNSRLVITSALEPPSKTATGIMEVLHPSALPEPQ